MNEKNQALANECTKYIEAHNLKGFSIETAISDNNIFGEELWLIKEIDPPIAVKEIVRDKEYISKFREDENIKIIASAQCLSMKSLWIAIHTINGCHYNNLNAGYSPRILKNRTFCICCVGELYNEIIDFNNLQQVFALPEKGAFALARAGSAWGRFATYPSEKHIDSVVWCS